MTKYWESSEGRTGNAERLLVHYFVQDGGSEEEAKDYLEANVPLSFGERERVDPELVARFRDGYYKFRVEYLTPEAKQRRGTSTEAMQLGEWTFSFDTTGGRQRKTQSISSRVFDENGEQSLGATFFNNAVNVTGSSAQAQAEGTDIVVPSLRFNLRARLSAGNITLAYVKLLTQLTGKTNNALFPPANMPFVDDQWDEGEVLFTGAVGSRGLGESGGLEIEFFFEAAENQVAPNLNTHNITDIEKKGHEFLWFWYAPTDNATIKITTPAPKYAIVDQLYDSDDLAQIFV